jgi:threonine synthase
MVFVYSRYFFDFSIFLPIFDTIEQFYLKCIQMNYISSRGNSKPKQFCEILLDGLAPDGGLYLPEHYPKIDKPKLAILRSVWTDKGYADLAFEIMSLYIDDIPSSDLLTLCRKTYTEEMYGTKEIVSLKKLNDGFYIEALSNGPTLAFKDMAMQLLGNLFEYELARRGETLNIFGATSGDTGSSAEYAMRGKNDIRVFMASPAGRMSPFQQAQMFSLMDENVHNIAIDGVFDDCQDLVKAVSNDTTFKAKYKIGTVNSINWARLLAQVVYYFAGYFQATCKDDQTVSFTVPSGNFGNACAGHVARMMGLPIETLLVATNENDVLDEFFKTGTYRVRSRLNTNQTSSPSMDISKASNFERFIFDLTGRNGFEVQALFEHSLSSTGAFTLGVSAMSSCSHYGFASGRSTHADRLCTIKTVYEKWNVILDPHTADGVHVARKFLEIHPQPNTPMIVLETALPIKFSNIILEAIDVVPPRPLRFNGLESLPQRVHSMPADVNLMKTYIAQMCEK